jgi:hypothetical protein
MQAAHDGHPSLWQTFFNLGGIAGAVSLLWQIANTARDQFRRPRLEILEFIQNRDIFNVRLDSSDESRYITVQVKNVGRRYARGCVARAKAIPCAGRREAKEIALHWADTPITFRTCGESYVDIAPGGTWRLDVAFSNKVRQGACLASLSALHGNYFSDAELVAGQHMVEIKVTFEDGNYAMSRLRLTSSPTWHELNASAAA